MKNFFLIFLLNLKDMWRNHKLVFIIINLFIFTSFSFFIISYDSFSYELSNNSINTYISNTYVFSFKNGSVTDKTEQIDNIISQNKNIRCVFFSYDNAPDKIIYDEKGRMIDYQEIIYLSYYGDFMESPQVYEGRWFTEEEYSIGSKLVVVPNYEYAILTKNRFFQAAPPEYSIGDTYNINGEEFTIIGKTKSPEYVYMIPYNSLTDKSNVQNRIYISTIEKYNEAQSQKFTDEISAVLNVKIEKSAELRLDYGDRNMRIMYYIIFNLTAVSLAYIYSYLIKSRKQIIGLFRMYGMNKSKCVWYLFFEYYIWVIANYILSCICTFIYITVRIDANIYHLNKMFRYLYIKEYISIFIAYSVIYFICFFPAIMKYVKNYDEINLMAGGNI